MKKFVPLFFYFLLTIAIGGAYFYPKMEPFLGAGQPCVKFVGTLPSTLSGAGVSSSASSIPLSSLEIQQTNQKLTMSDFCDVGYATLEPGNTSKQEFISFTGITQNSNGSAILTGVTRGLSPVYPYTASSSVRFNHSGGTRVVISNSPSFYNNFVVQGNNATITAQQIFSSTTPPHYDLVPANHNAGTYVSTTSEFVSWAGLAAVTNSGTVNAEDAVKGIVEMATEAEAAAGTSLGATGARLALGANISSAVSSANKVVFSNSSGKIDGSYQATSTNYFFGAVQSFVGGFIGRASSTMNSILNFAVLPESSAIATTSAQLTPRSMQDYNAYTLMSTSSRSGSKLASTSISMATNCNSTTVTRQAGYKIWKYGNVYVFASSTNSQAFQSTLYLSKNGAGTTSLSNSTTNTMWISAVFSVEPGDELQVWCSEDNASANLTGVSDFAIFATSSDRTPVEN